MNFQELALNLPAVGFEDQLADLYDYANQPYTESIESPNDMLVDSDDLLVDPENEKDDVVNINPDSDGEPTLRADDRTLPPPQRSI
jgi:hypothetical protein